MILKYPFMLLLLLFIPVLIYFRYGRKHRNNLSFSDGKTLDKLPVSWAVRASIVLPILYAIGMLFLVIAISRPLKGLEESNVNTEAIDIVLLVDVSTSMEAIDFSTRGREMNRLEAAKEVITEFVKNRPNDLIGMVAFSALPYTVSPLTLDHSWLLKQMDRLYTGMLEDGTAIGDALASAINRLRDGQSKSKVVILLTDGMNNAGTLSPENAAQAAEALDIKIYTIGAGSKGLVKMPVKNFFGGKSYQTIRSEIDEPMLTEIAETTGGQYFRATDLDSLKDIYQQIDEMEKTEITVESFTRFEERFMPFMVLALICLVIEKLLSLTRLGRLP